MNGINESSPLQAILRCLSPGCAVWGCPLPTGTQAKHSMCSIHDAYVAYEMRELETELPFVLSESEE